MGGASIARSLKDLRERNIAPQSMKERISDFEGRSMHACRRQLGRAGNNPETGTPKMKRDRVVPNETKVAQPQPRPEKVIKSSHRPPSVETELQTPKSA
jgi:hypothetical protein